MKQLLAVMALLTSFSAFSADKPYNMNPYEWKSDIADVKGSGEETSLDHVWERVQKHVDALARGGGLKDGQEMTVTVTWRGKDFRRRVVAHVSYPVELPRGADRRRELPRGPLPQYRPR